MRRPEAALLAGRLRHTGMTTLQFATSREDILLVSDRVDALMDELTRLLALIPQDFDPVALIESLPTSAFGIDGPVLADEARSLFLADRTLRETCANLASEATELRAALADVRSAEGSDVDCARVSMAGKRLQATLEALPRGYWLP